MRISDCISDVCSSDLYRRRRGRAGRTRDRQERQPLLIENQFFTLCAGISGSGALFYARYAARCGAPSSSKSSASRSTMVPPSCSARSEEHTSELQSLMRISYAVFCLTKKNNITKQIHADNDK